MGVAPKLKAHQEGSLHRAFSIFLFRSSDGALLMQKRHAGKYHCPDLWSNTCCGHPRPGESVQQAAMRRLFEELGLRIPLEWVGLFEYRADCGQGMVEHEMDHVFSGDISQALFDQMYAPHPNEIGETAWVLPGDLQITLQTHTDIYTPWLHKALNCCLSGRGRTC